MNQPTERWQRQGRRLSDERGQSLVEFAFSLFIIVLLLIAVVDIGRAFNSYIAITNAAREGARFAGRVSHVDGIDTLVREAAYKEGDNNNVDLRATSVATVTIDPAGYASRPSGAAITVTVKYTFSTFIGGLVGIREIPMRSDTEMILVAGCDLDSACTP